MRIGILRGRNKGLSLQARYVSLARLVLVAGMLALMAMAPARAQGSSQYSDAKLDAYLDAAIKVEALREAAAEQRKSLVSRMEVQALQVRLEKATAAAVAGTPNMTIDEFNAIAAAAKADPALKQRLNEKLSKRAAGVSNREVRQLEALSDSRLDLMFALPVQK